MGVSGKLSQSVTVFSSVKLEKQKQKQNKTKNLPQRVVIGIQGNNFM